jgi:SAM-dependent methyltransferase
VPVTELEPAVGQDAPHILTPAYYQKLFEIEQHHGWARGMRALAALLLDPLFRGAQTVSILDAGCGTGGMLTWYERFRGADPTGIDISLDGLAFCQQRGHDKLALASALELPFPAERFDLVVSTDVLQHLPDPPGDRAALAEAFRVLRPGGYLYIRTNSRFGMGPQRGNAAVDYRRYDRRVLDAHVRAAGFVIKRSTYANCLPSLLAIARRRARRGNDATVARDHGLRVHVRPPSRRWIDQALYLELSLEAWYVRLGGTLPFGHSMAVLAQKPPRSDTRPGPAAGAQ